MRRELRFSSAAVPKETGQSAASSDRAAGQQQDGGRSGGAGQEGPRSVGRQSAKLVKERWNEKAKRRMM